MTPFTIVGAGSSAASRIVGATSMTWWNCVRISTRRVDAAWPVYDQSVAGSAKVRRDLLGPLVRRVHRVRPANGVVVECPRRTQVVDALDQEIRRDQIGRLADGRLVQRADQRAFRGRAVVADDVVDERVVENSKVVDARRRRARRDGRHTPGIPRRSPFGARAPAAVVVPSAPTREFLWVAESVRSRAE